MSLLAWFDNRTLLACQLILAVVFAAVFWAMRRIYPTVRGLYSATMAFLLGIPGIIAIFLRGSIPDFVSIVIGNLLIQSAMLCVYDATVQFSGGRRLTKYLYVLTIPTAIVLWYYSSIRPDIVPRIIIMALAEALILSLASWELVTRSKAFSSHLTMRILGFSFIFQVGSQIYRAAMTALHGAPQNLMARNPVQTLTFAFNIFYVCSSALCSFFIVNQELISRSRDESEQDALSGAFNRRGIELRLNAELNRIQRNAEPLTVALIDVDHFKHINDSAGHATGDTVIRVLVDVFTHRLRAYDSLGRYGGDEFLLLLPHTNCTDANLVVDRLSLHVRTSIRSDIDLPVTLSVGLTEAVPSDSAETLLVRADKALYAAKHAGRNCIRTILHESSASAPSRFVTSLSGDLSGNATT